MVALPDFDRLVSSVAADAASDDPVERLAAAARLRDDLDELAEAVLDHFVEQARHAGCSWSRIGAALGVSKQAAQQRHTASGSVGRRLLGRITRRKHGPLFQRFADQARDIVVLAQEEARARNHTYIGTEHVLLGLLLVQGGVAARALESMDVPADEVRTRVVEIAPPGERASPGHLPFTRGAKRALELSLRESIELGHDYIGTEHILLGLVRLGEGTAYEILSEHGVDHARARAAVLSLLASAA